MPNKGISIRYAEPADLDVVGRIDEIMKKPVFLLSVDVQIIMVVADGIRIAENFLEREAQLQKSVTNDLQPAFQLWMDDRPLLLERLRVTPQSRRGAAGLRGLPVTATLLATPAGAVELDWVRSQLGEALTSGVTLLDNLLVVRYLGDSTEECRNLFTRIWAGLRPPVLGLEPCPPRIWAT